MIVDLSFLPKELISAELREASMARIEYPYIHNNIFTDDLLIMDSELSKNAAFVQSRNQFRQNFWEFEDKLLILADNLYEEGNSDLAENCYRYLMDIGSKLAHVKERLILIYLENKNKIGLRDVKRAVKKQLKEPDAKTHSEHQFHEDLWEKYFKK